MTPRLKEPAMKHSFIFVSLFALLLGAISARAGRPAPPKPIEGTVEEVFDRYFTIAYNKAIVKVMVDNNTQFKSGSGEDIKPGVKVDIEGTTYNSRQILARTITVKGTSTQAGSKI